jgi:ketosteroid isomerase-like protein
MEIDSAELRGAADELAIRSLVARYADAVTQNDGQAWIETWAADGRWFMGGSASEGHEKMLETWKTLMAMFERVIQLPQHGLVELAGDRATGRWGVVELGRTRGGDPIFTLGSYHDTYRRVGTSWKFSERRLEFVYTGPPDLSGQWFSC